MGADNFFSTVIQLLQHSHSSANRCVGQTLTNDLTPPTKIDSMLGYLNALLHTMVEAHDKVREKPSDFTQYIIETPREISAFRFDLTDREAEELYNAGRAAANEVDWRNGSSDKQIMQFYDPKPYKTLEFSLRQTKALFDVYRKKELWVDRLKQVATFTLKIERDWSSEYEFIDDALVEGDKQMFVSEFRAMEIPSGTPTSLMDFPCEIEEIHVDGSATDLVRIPAFNTETTKGFLAFFVPPVDSRKKRRIRKVFRVPKEFARTLAVGAPDEAAYSVDQNAPEHELSLKFRVLIDTDLPAVMPTANFGTALKQAATEYIQKTNRSYKVFECQLDNEKITNEKMYRVTLCPQSNPAAATGSRSPGSATAAHT